MKKRRQKQKTYLIYCEGLEDEIFLKCLKKIYKNDELSTINIDVKTGAGGSQVHLVEEAIRKGQLYDKTIIKIDGDRGVSEMAKAEKLANKCNIIMLKSIPCTEKMLISILEPKKNINSWDTKQCKSYFEETYISSSQRTNLRTYLSVFTRNKLEKGRITSDGLDRIIKIFENKN